MQYLITSQEVISLGLSGKKMDPVKIEPNIPVAEFEWVQKFLGDEFYYELVTQKNGAGLSADNLVLWNQILGRYVAWAALFYSLDDLQWDISAQGLMLNSTEFSQSDKNGYANLQKPKREKLMIAQRMVDDFLRRNATKYPKYKGNISSCATNKKPDVYASFGLNLDEETEEGCCISKPKVEFFPETTPTQRTYSFGIDCPAGTSITLKRVIKAGVVLMSGNAIYSSAGDLLDYLQTLDSDWEIDGTNVRITSEVEWKLIVCCCEASDPPSLELSIDVNCVGRTADIIITGSNLPNGTAHIILQIFIEGDWQTTDTEQDIVNGENVFTDLPLDLADGTYQFRAISGDVISNVVELVIGCTVECDGTIEITGDVEINCEEHSITVPYHVEGEVNHSFWIRPAADPDEWTLIGACRNIVGPQDASATSSSTMGVPWDWPENGDYVLKIVCCGDDSVLAETNFTIGCPILIGRYNIQYQPVISQPTLTPFAVQIEAQGWQDNGGWASATLQLNDITDSGLSFQSGVPEDIGANIHGRMIFNVADLVADHEYLATIKFTDVIGMVSISSALFKVDNSGVLSRAIRQGAYFGGGSPDYPDIAVRMEIVNYTSPTTSFIPVNPKIVEVDTPVSIGPSGLIIWAVEINVVNADTMTKLYNSHEGVGFWDEIDLSVDFPLFVSAHSRPYVTAFSMIKLDSFIP